MDDISIIAPASGTNGASSFTPKCVRRLVNPGRFDYRCADCCCHPKRFVWSELEHECGQHGSNYRQNDAGRDW
jgi:hypothetical protein